MLLVAESEGELDAGESVPNSHVLAKEEALLW